MESEVEKVKQWFRLKCGHSISSRIEQLKQLYAMLTFKESLWLEALYKDLKKPPSEAYSTEIMVVKNEISHFILHLSGWLEEESSSLNQVMKWSLDKASIRKVPIGTVLIISPWNYPLQLSLLPLVGAIAGGNGAILKPSEMAPHVSSLLALLIPEYLDNRITVIEGGIPETTRLLELDFDLIFYTGSTHIGKIVMSAASAHLTPVILELGGKSPCFVDATVDPVIAADRIMLVDLIASQKAIGGLVFGGQSNPSDLFIEPTVFKITKDPTESPLLQGELFGPILPIVIVDSIDSTAVSLVRQICPNPLALYIFTKSNATFDFVTQKISAGGIVRNDCIMHAVVSTLPFGGVGESGMGSYHGKASFEAFTRRQAVLQRSIWTDITNLVRYPHFSGKFKSFWFNVAINAFEEPLPSTLLVFIYKWFRKIGGWRTVHILIAFMIGYVVK